MTSHHRGLLGETPRAKRREGVVLGFDGERAQRQSFKAFPVPLPVRLTPGLRGEVGGKERWTPIKVSAGTFPPSQLMSEKSSTFLQPVSLAAHEGRAKLLLLACTCAQIQPLVNSLLHLDKVCMFVSSL